MREQALEEFRATLKDVILQLRTGSIEIPSRRIAEKVLNRITDDKVRKLCEELNSTPDENVLSLTQCLGETLKWSLWYRAKQLRTALSENGNLWPLLDEAIKLPYYTDAATNKFLKQFRDNFLKAFYDMVRHSESYIPTTNDINPAIAALEKVLEETFP